MTECTAIVTVPHLNGVPKHATVNTWAFVGTDTPVDMATKAGAMLTNFYNESIAGVRLTQNFGARTHNWQFPVITVYNLADAKPRLPVATLSPTWSAPASGDNGPAECAVTLSFEAGQLSGQPRGRRRGRIYFGPLLTSAFFGTGTNECRPHPDLIQRLRAGAMGMVAAGDVQCRWGVYSRSDNVVRHVQNGWVDNAFDTQRRRGPDPTARGTWS